MKSITESKFHIATGIDTAYAPYASVMMISVLQKTKRPQDVVFHVLYFSLSVENQEKLQEAVRRYGAQIQFHPVKLQETEGLVINSRLTVNTYLRLFIPSRLQGISRALYLDGDTYVRTDVVKFFSGINITNHALAGVYDIAMFTPNEAYVRPGPYFNAGVIYINLDIWRTIDVLQIAKDIGTEADTNCDQDILNRIWKDKWLPLPQKTQYLYLLGYVTDCARPARRFLGFKAFWAMRLQPDIVHFIGHVKPWTEYHFSLYFFEYRKLLRQSPWKNIHLPPRPRLQDFLKRCALRLYWFMIPYRIRNRLRLRQVLKKTV